MKLKDPISHSKTSVGFRLLESTSREVFPFSIGDRGQKYELVTQSPNAVAQP